MNLFLRKVAPMLLVLLGAAHFASADIVSLNFEPSNDDEAFEVLYRQLPTFELNADVGEALRNEGVNRAYRATFNGHDGEVRYLLFKETGVNEKASVTMYEALVLMNLAGTRLHVDKRGNYKELVVKKTFNADMGSFVSVVSPNSLFAEGYKYMEIEFFYKKNQGICVRAFLYNDTGFVGNNKNESDFYKNYASFTFMEKTKKGKYIRPAQQKTD